MLVLIVGLILFLGVHSVHILAPAWRARQVQRIGANGWKALYALLSLAGFVAIVWGYGAARAEPTVLWVPPRWTYHLAIVLTLPAFVLLVAAYVPRNRLRTWIGHPMLAGVKLWALAHLLSNGMLADLVLFGGFLAWSVTAFSVARRRDRAAGRLQPSGFIGGDLACVFLGFALWAAFAHWLHLWLIGVDPMAWIR